MIVFICYILKACYFKFFMECLKDFQCDHYWSLGTCKADRPILAKEVQY